MTSNAITKIAKSAMTLTLAASLVSFPNTSEAVNSVPNQLQGEWLYGRISSIQYENQFTGRPAPANGSSDRFKVSPNGDYQRVRLLQITTYGCSSYLFIQEKGKVTINGQKFTFQPAQSYLKGQQCSAAKTYERRNTAKVETYAWSLETNDSNQQVLLLDTEDGKGRAHYGRPN